MVVICKYAQVVINRPILQGNVLTETVLGEQTIIQLPISYSAKNSESWLAVSKVTATIIRFTFLTHHVGLS